MKLDSHQHFWNYSAAEYPWIAPGSALQRDWLPQDLQPLLSAAGVDGCIAVQARQTIEESRWLLELAAHSPFMKGVVGWADLRSDSVEKQLAELAANPVFRGVRHVVQDEKDDRFLLGAEFFRGLESLPSFGLTYDLLIVPRQLPAAVELVRRLPAQPFVLDHLAKPPIETGVLSPWREQIRELAQAPNVCCKISGMVTEASFTAWKAAYFEPYLEVVLEAFGPERLMIGSDWPVCLLAGSYARVFGLARDWCARLTAPEQAAVLGGNAARFYGIRSTGN